MRQLPSKGKVAKQFKTHIRRTAIRKYKSSNIELSTKRVGTKQDLTEPTLGTAEDHTEEYISMRKDPPKGRTS